MSARPRQCAGPCRSKASKVMAMEKTPSDSMISRSNQWRWRRRSRLSSVSSDSGSPTMILPDRLDEDLGLHGAGDEAVAVGKLVHLRQPGRSDLASECDSG